MRFYEQWVREQQSTSALVVVSGPRQVGKTAACGGLSKYSLDWNRIADRLLILRGPAAVLQHLGLQRAREATVVIENLHGYRAWPAFLRRLRARSGPNLRFVITMLGAVRRSGEARGSSGAVAGALPADARTIRIHPWTVGECARPIPNLGTSTPLTPPAPVSDADWSALLEHGGFPEPFAARDSRFGRRWSARLWEELIDHDLPRLASVRDPAILQMFAQQLASRSATPLIYSDSSRECGVTVDTVRRWTDLLEMLQLGFRVRPWFARVPKALRKEPRWFLRDWSVVSDPQARAQTFVACHLLKAVQGWNDRGLGRFELRYVRDKLKREVDFLMLRDGRPWFLVAIANEAIASASLRHFQEFTRAPHAFRIVMDAPYSTEDCFAHTEPTTVPARTLLSQLL